MKRLNMWTRAAGRTAVLALALSGVAGCGASGAATHPAAGDSASAGIGGVSGATSADPAVAATGTAPASAAASVLPDGRSAVYLTNLDTTKKTVTFDLIEFLTGPAAKAEWKKEHPEDPNGPDNDYMIINNNKLLRTLPVAPDARCVVLSTLGGTDTKTITFAALPALLKKQNEGMTPTPPDIAMLPFWLTVRQGTVVTFEEQFLP